MSDFYTIQNSLLPVVRANLSDDDGYINLSGCSAYFVYQIRNAKESPVTGSATIISPISGEVQYDWVSGNVGNYGTYFARWKIVDADGKAQYYPNNGQICYCVSKEF